MPSCIFSWSYLPCHDAGKLLVSAHAFWVAEMSAKEYIPFLERIGYLIESLTYHIRVVRVFHDTDKDRTEKPRRLPPAREEIS